MRVAPTPPCVLTARKHCYIDRRWVVFRKTFPSYVKIPMRRLGLFKESPTYGHKLEAVPDRFPIRNIRVQDNRLQGSANMLSEGDNS